MAAPLSLRSSNSNAASNAAVDKITKLSFDSQRRLLQYSQSILEKNRNFEDLRRKMDAIDIAYARYTAEDETQITEEGTIAGATAADIFAKDDVTPPIVVSQVDSYVAYLSEVFLSGVPLFPVVSTPFNRKNAETLEAIIDDHASIGGYARQLLMFLRDGCKYNFSAIEVEWDSISQFSVLQDVLRDSGQKIERKAKKFTRVTRLNPRNIVWDWSVSPGDVAEHGDYAGYLCKVSRTKIKRLFNKWSLENKMYVQNFQKAMDSALDSASGSPGASANYHEDPIISNYQVSFTTGRNAAPNWDLWFDPKSSRRGPPVLDTMYEIFYLYARIMPADFGITAPQPNTPQIWKFAFVNNICMVYAERVISAYDYLPILFGQPIEDGLGYQTQSVAESEIPFQDAAATLFNIRFAAARRAVSDRALYLPDMIKPSDINSRAAAPKIPVNISALSNKSLQDAYHQIPFDLRGTETTIQDATTIVEFSRQLHGINKPRQGEFQKGNKSVQEWNDTMGGSDGRLRLPALTLEHQVFSPLKSILSLNILQYGEDGTVVSQATGRNIDIKIAELRKANLAFKMADGYTPKSKLASTDVLLAGMQMLGTSPILQQAYGPMLPSMFAHFMSLSGVKGFDQYDPKYQEAPLQAPGLPANDPSAIPGQQPGMPAPQVPPGGPGLTPNPNAPPGPPMSQNAPQAQAMQGPSISPTPTSMTPNPVP